MITAARCLPRIRSGAVGLVIGLPPGDSFAFPLRRSLFNRRKLATPITPLLWPAIPVRQDQRPRLIRERHGRLSRSAPRAGGMPWRIPGAGCRQWSRPGRLLGGRLACGSRGPEVRIHRMLADTAAGLLPAPDGRRQDSVRSSRVRRSSKDKNIAGRGHNAWPPRRQVTAPKGGSTSHSSALNLYYVPMPPIARYLISR
jgi:hypothetical protein